MPKLDHENADWARKFIRGKLTEAGFGHHRRGPHYWHDIVCDFANMSDHYHQLLDDTLRRRP